MPTTTKSFRLKDKVTVVPAGLPVTFLQDKPSVCLVQGGRPEPYRVRVTSAFAGAPGVKKMENWMCEGGCKSVLGYWVEPDGWDHEGSPSWLLALGLI